MGLKQHNNPLGQHVVSDQVGTKHSVLLPEQSADLVNEVKKKANKLQKEGVEQRQQDSKKR